MATQADENSIVIPCPIGGLDYSQPEYGLPPTYTKYLFNLIPENGQLRTRPPMAVALTTAGWTSSGDAKWLMRCEPYEPILAMTTKGHVDSVTGTVGAFVAGSVFVGGSTVTASMSFMNGGKLIYTQYPAYEPRTWDTGGDGTLSFTFPGANAWSTMTKPLITGGHPFKGRVYWWSYDNAADQAFAYTAVNATAGVLTAFPLKNLVQRGGYIVCITSLTMDGGAGVDDLLAVIFSTGEVLVYQGSDPSSATDWELVGRFQAPPPIHCGAVARMGGDVLMLTRKGLLPLQQYIKASFGMGEPDWMQRINPAIAKVLGNQATDPFGHVRYCENADLLFVILDDGVNGYCWEFRPRQNFWGRNVIMKSTSARAAGNPTDFELTNQGIKWYDCIEFRGTTAFVAPEVFFSVAAANSSGYTARLLEYSAWNEVLSDLSDAVQMYGSWTTPAIPLPNTRKVSTVALLHENYDSPSVNFAELYASYDFRTAVLEADSFATNTSSGFAAGLKGDASTAIKLRVDFGLYPGSALAPWYVHGLRVKFDPVKFSQPKG